MISFRERKLGIAEDNGRYDLPFHSDRGADFLTILVGLMTFLAVLALAASLSLSDLSRRWSSGMGNSLTIEIPSQDSDNEARSGSQIKEIQGKLADILKKSDVVSSHKIISEDDVREMLKPWLGDSALVDSLPLPGLISVEMKSRDEESLKALATQIQAIDAGARLDAHDAWLKALLRLTGSLRWVTLAIVAVIGTTTIFAVVSAIRARLAIHSGDVELLHLMGADDNYIMRQFQRHTLSLSLRGAVAGTVCALALIFLLALSAHSSDQSLVPDIRLRFSDFVFVLLTPAIVCTVVSLSARFTVLRALGKMP